MGDVSKCKVGDVVILLDRNFKPRQVTIVRVGRINIYTAGWRGCREQAYDRATGAIKDGYGGASLCTIEEHEQTKRAVVARKRLNDFGIEVHRVAKERVLAIAEALAPLMAEWAAATPGGGGAT